MNASISVDFGIQSYMDYHRANSRPNTIRGFEYTLNKFRELFSGNDIADVPDSDVATFLEMITDGLSASTKSNRAGQISAFFNFVADTFDLNLINPCAKGIIKKLYKQPRHTPPELLDKEIVDEIIYRAQDCIGGTGDPFEVLAVCDCGHRWKLRGVTQITQLIENK